MNGEHVDGFLAEYERGTLPPAERLRVSLHLEHCQHCAAEYASLQQLAHLLDIEHQPSPAARSRLVAALAAAAPPSAALSAWQSWWRGFWQARPLGALSYSAGMLAVGLVVGQWLPPQSLGFTSPWLAEQSVSADRLVQLCAVPPPPENLL